MRNQSGPSLAAHSKTNQSLILQWLPSPAAAHDVANLTYSIQRLTVGLEDDWQFHDDVRWLSRQRVRISGLRPYVTYKVGLRLLRLYTTRAVIAKVVLFSLLSVCGCVSVCVCLFVIVIVVIYFAQIKHTINTAVNNMSRAYNANSTYSSPKLTKILLLIQT